MEAADELVALAREDPDVLAVLLYGSHARGDARPRSDVDLCLVLGPALGPEASAAKGAAYLHPDLDVRLFSALSVPRRSPSTATWRSAGPARGSLRSPSRRRSTCVPRSCGS